ncbi:MAG: hypothetical protein HRT72_13035 [Flavobacteriales bacterium]|nr:hypothetical protein [Flavobacteriales bacterium]
MNEVVKGEYSVTSLSELVLEKIAGYLEYVNNSDVIIAHYGKYMTVEDITHALTA